MIHGIDGLDTGAAALGVRGTSCTGRARAASIENPRLVSAAGLLSFKLFVC
jgi:hypothetical protein